MPLLARAARLRAAQLAGRKACVVTNGGNCVLPGMNWVHYVHAAYDPAADAVGVSRAAAAWQRRYVLGCEKRALAAARVVICNSERTRRDVVERLGVPESRARVVYYGTDASRFAPASPETRAAARAALGVADDRRVALFVGALGDRRKGFDALFGAWAALARGGWNADLFVAGEGRELPAWRQRAAAEGLAERVHFLGFRQDVHALLEAADVLVHPARYEAYGLSVHEAICSGVPAVVTANAGAAERYPGGLRGLLLPEVSTAAVREALEWWLAHEAACRAAAVGMAATWRARTWDDMADDIIALGSSL
jgi:glycosyltransferase involved in cell wall biosynthesis